MTMRSMLFVAGVMVTGCGLAGSSGADESALQVALPTGDAGLAVYRTGEVVPEADLVPLDPAALGGELLDGDVRWSARIDLAEGSFIGGVFQATEGRYRVVYTGSAHATIHAGKVIATTADGSYTLGAGDSFFVTKGTEVVFETVGPIHQASFLTSSGTPDVAPRFTLRPKGSDVPGSELFPLGGWENFDSEVLEGDPEISGRFDYSAGTESAGVLASTRGIVFQHGAGATEHGVVLVGKLTMTDPNGVARELRRGDAFRLRKGTPVHWALESPRVQVHFWGVR